MRVKLFWFCSYSSGEAFISRTCHFSYSVSYIFWILTKSPRCLSRPLHLNKAWIQTSSPQNHTGVVLKSLLSFLTLSCYFLPITQSLMILTPNTMCVSPHTTKQFSDTSWVSYNSPQIWHSLPRDGIRWHHSLRALFQEIVLTSHAKLKSMWWTCLCFWLTSYKSKVPITSNLSLISFHEWLTELREICCLLDDWFVIKEYNSRIARRKRSIAQGMRIDVEFPHTLWVHPFPESPHVHQPRPPSFWVFMGAALHRHDSFNHWPLVTELNLQPLSSPQRLGGTGRWDWKVQTSNHLVGSPEN